MCFVSQIKTAYLERIKTTKKKKKKKKKLTVLWFYRSGSVLVIKKVKTIV